VRVHHDRFIPPAGVLGTTAMMPTAWSPPPGHGLVTFTTTPTTTVTTWSPPGPPPGHGQLGMTFASRVRARKDERVPLLQHGARGSPVAAVRFYIYMGTIPANHDFSKGPIRLII